MPVPGIVCFGSLAFQEIVFLPQMSCFTGPGAAPGTDSLHPLEEDYRGYFIAMGFEAGPERFHIIFCDKAHSISQSLPFPFRPFDFDKEEWTVRL